MANVTYHQDYSETQGRPAFVQSFVPGYGYGYGTQNVGYAPQILGQQNNPSSVLYNPQEQLSVITTSNIEYLRHPQAAAATNDSRVIVVEQSNKEKPHWFSVLCCACCAKLMDELCLVIIILIFIAIAAGILIPFLK